MSKVKFENDKEDVDADVDVHSDADADADIDAYDVTTDNDDLTHTATS